MTTKTETNKQQLNINWQHKISGIDIELKEQQFMHDEAEYYKLLKTKSKRNTHAEDRTTRSFVERVIIQPLPNPPLVKGEAGRGR